MNTILRYIFLNLFVRLIVNIILGVNVRNRDRLPEVGPAIIIANHNSHLDAMVLITILKQKAMKIVRPVAAMDYFLKNPLLSWFSQKIIRIIPLRRDVKFVKEDMFSDCYDSLKKNEILIFFPEGSRGEPEKISVFKSGISRISEKFPNVPIIPVFMHGLGKALPKGEAILVPFFCDVFVGNSFQWTGDRGSFMDMLGTRMAALEQEGSYL
ncbi:MAG: 1-acyl-sn-glycerol-3-phosphate acyltransferase [Candidatus Omnitrophica bacterium]|nr:1-acyl-sn-glycerol-3-phosphate acyltransferase [Candidatus Omnitrophota bacterium]